MIFRLAATASFLLFSSVTQASVYDVNGNVLVDTSNAITSLNKSPVYLLAEGVVTEYSYQSTIGGYFGGYSDRNRQAFRLWVNFDTAHFGADTNSSTNDAHYETYSNGAWIKSPGGSFTIYGDIRPKAQVQLDSGARTTIGPEFDKYTGTRLTVDLHDAIAGTSDDTVNIKLALGSSEKISLSLSRKGGNLLSPTSYLFDWIAESGDTGSATYTSGNELINDPSPPLNASYRKYSIDLNRLAISTLPIQPVSEVPIPGAAILFGSALAGLGLQAKRRKA